MKTIFVTGSTGFLGSYFLYHLLQHTDDIIYCLARGKDNLSPEERVYQKLDTIHRSFCIAGLSNFCLEEKINEKVKVVSGNITKKNLGLTNDFKNANISEFWHIASSVQFSPLKHDEVMKTNVTGGKNVLSFIKKYKIPLLNYVSTAYVAGQKTGDISEGLADKTFNVNNAYEESKRIIEAEIIKANLRGDFSYRIFRPGIIVGHSVTLEPDASMGGLYGFMYLCAVAKNRIDSLFPGYLKNNCIKLKADKHSSLSLIPVDKVVNTLFEISKEKLTLNRIYHVTPLLNTSLGYLAETVGKLCGLDIKLVSSADTFSVVDQLFNRQVGRYTNYLFYDKKFERSHQNIDHKDDDCAIDNKKLYEMVERFYNNTKDEKMQQTTSFVS